jgi:toxin ParE1/3/4
MDFQVVWTEPAVADLEAITRHIATQSPTAADRVGNSILEHVEILRSFPFIGPVYPSDPRETTREIVCMKYRIFYRVNEEQKQVEILTVWHGSRQEPEIPA